MSEHHDTTAAPKVQDYAGVRIGSVGADGDVYDHAHVRIGVATPAGDVRDFAGVRIGKVVAAT